MSVNPGKKVVLGMSGGVDSSVSAYLLKKRGFEVIGLFMKNWEEDDTEETCTAERDFFDVKRVCEVFEIPYYSVSFAKEYRESVFVHFLDGLKRGVTPNPDILCNREIKFGPFLDFADRIGADYIATGHYCRLIKENDGYSILKAADKTKDQSYFLCGLNQNQLSRVLFPLGDIKKTEVRKIAREFGLVNAQKKDSTGICFIGERKFRDFIKKYLGNRPGAVKTLDGKVVGHHEGLMYYTIGQRKGLGLGGSTENTDRWFVIRKDTENNVLYVNNGECKELFSSRLEAENFNWIPKIPKTNKFRCNAKVRYRQDDQNCEVEILNNAKVRVTFQTPQRAVTAGQWVVLYDGEKCLGGGEIVSL
jgi:tRNA-specific 2-thiouridylase